MNNVFIIMSGLPASGKSTLGKLLSQRLDVPFIDKDDILESLFELEGCTSSEERSQLSRESDSILKEQARVSSGAILVSFWRSFAAHEKSGTPIEWLSNLSSNLIEIHCECDPSICVNRFLNRNRHPGHLDKDKKESELLDGFKHLSEAGPLELGKLIKVDTSKPVEIDTLLESIRSELVEG